MLQNIVLKAVETVLLNTLVFHILHIYCKIYLKYAVTGGNGKYDYKHYFPRYLW